MEEKHLKGGERRVGNDKIRKSPKQRLQKT